MTLSFTSTLRVFLLLFSSVLFYQCADYKIHQDDTVEDVLGVSTPTGELEYSTLMVGDLGYDYERGLTTLGAMVDAMPEKKKMGSLLLLGDITGKDGLNKKNDEEEAHLDAIIERLQRVKGKVFYTPGENELGRDGKFGRLDRLEEYFDDHSEKKVRFMPNNVCSGPDDEELIEGVGLIGVNSAWYLSNWSNDDEVSEGCDFKNRDAMTFALADEIKGYRDQVKIVMMHHPIQSNGNRGGIFSARQHLFPLADLIPGAYIPLPVIGTLARGIQAAGGGRNDVHNLLYQQLINKIKLGIDDEVNVIFVSGHEHYMMNVHEGEYIEVTAGSGAERSPVKGGDDAAFAYGAIGFSRLDFYDSGEVFLGFYTVDEDGKTERVYNQRIIEDRRKPQDVGIEEVPTEMVSTELVKTPVYGEEYAERGGFYKGTFGRHYRELYWIPVEVKVMNIDTFQGGLDPYRRGGGMTTMSLHTEASSGRQYQLRSVRKNPAQILPGLLENSFAADITKDQFTAIHPYAPLALPPWQKALGLYGADPLLRYVPKQPGLGSYNTNFGGEMYWVEQRPDDDWSGTGFFGNSKKIVGNDDAIEGITDDWKHYVDDNNFARARLFDFWIGDWDRHSDQWRWSTFEEEDGRTRYVPVARDRDQVFSNFDGTLLRIARLFVPEARKLRPFTEDLDKAKWRAMNGKWNDRVFLNQLTREEMIAEAKAIQATITPDMIDEALLRMPPEVIQYSLEQERIGDKLKARLTQLDAFAADYYDVLAEKVNVLATGKDDVIRVTGLADGDVHVQVYDADKEGEADELYYDRTFHPGETKEVRIYGLDGDDHFLVSGERSPIRVLVIGGTDGDEVIGGGDLKVKAYDEKGGMDIERNDGKIHDRRSDRSPDLNTYRFKEYYPDYTIPMPALGFNVDDGLFVGLGLSRVIQGFNADPYKTKHTLSAKYSTNEFWQASYDAEFNNTFSPRRDITLQSYYRSPGYVVNFFGLGNEAAGQPDEDETEIPDEDILDFNRARQEQIMINPMLRFRGRRDRFAVSVGPSYSSVTVDDDTPDFALISQLRAAGDRSEFLRDDVFTRQQFGGIMAKVTFNNLPLPFLPEDGLKFDIFAGQTWNLDNTDRSFTTVGGQFTVYRMMNKLVGFATRIGFEHNGGDPEYYQLSALGGRTNYRAARAERYRGNTSVYQNIDLRIRGFGFGKGTVPTIGGFILGLDHGRVWLNDEDSDVWHVAYGGGVWMAPFGAAIFTATYFTDSEDARVQFGFGFPF